MVVCANFPSSVTDREFQSFWRSMNRLEATVGSLVIVGDFNARMGTATGGSVIHVGGGYLTIYLG